MGYVFTSDFFGKKPHPKLQAAANDHAFHIVPGSSGDHVSLIQQALFNIDTANISTTELGLSRYGSSTSNAVTKFKSDRQIFNYKNEIDPIVGVNTMRRLDKEMARIEGKAKPTHTRTQDIVVHIVGQIPTSADAGKKTNQGQTSVGVQSIEDFRKEVETAEYLADHEPLVHQQWNGGLPNFGNDPTIEIVDFIKAKVAAALSVGSDKLGRIIVIGMSSGGRNTATVAHQFADRPLLTYVAAIDAAFNDANDVARSSNVNATRSENFFQTVGNDVVPGNEFHGTIPNYQRNVKLDDLSGVKQVAEKLTLALDIQKQTLINQAHTIAVRHGYILAKATAINILRLT